MALLPHYSFLLTRGSRPHYQSGVFDNPEPIKNTLKKADPTRWTYRIYTRPHSLRMALSNEETVLLIFHRKTRATKTFSGPTRNSPLPHASLAQTKFCITAIEAEVK